MANESFDGADFLDLDESDLSDDDQMKFYSNSKKMNDGQGGRDTMLTPDLIKTISQYVKHGAYLTHAASACGITPALFYSWMHKGEEEPESIYGMFRKQMVVAFSEAAMKHELRIEQASNDDWKASAWWLAKMFPDIYGKERIRVEMSGPDGLPVQIKNETKTEVLISDSELQKMFAYQIIIDEANSLPSANKDESDVATETDETEDSEDDTE
jgi:hypothetical protein